MDSIEQLLLFRELAPIIRLLAIEASIPRALIQENNHILYRLKHVIYALYRIRFLPVFIYNLRQSFRFKLSSFIHK